MFGAAVCGVTVLFTTSSLPSTMTVPSSVLMVAAVPRSRSGSPPVMSRYGARLLDGSILLQRSWLALQLSEQLSLISAVPLLLQRTRLLPSQRSAWFALQIRLGPLLSAASTPPNGVGRGNPQPPAHVTHATSCTSRRCFPMGHNYHADGIRLNPTR